MKWRAKLIRHRHQSRIAVYFETTPELIERIRKIEGAMWSASLKVWHLPDTADNRLRFKISSAEKKIPNKGTIAQLEMFTFWLQSRRYSTSTIKTYSEALKSFLLFFENKPVAEICNQDVILYNNAFILKNNLSSSYQNQIVNAIKLYFKIIQDRSIDIEKVHRPKREHKLPNVLSKEEVRRILNASANLKHRMMLAMIYSCGLRCGELIALKMIHIDSERHIVLLKNAKGKKDRIVPLSLKILEMLRDYYKIFKPTSYLFEGVNPGKPYDSRSLQKPA
jgi:integrase/recombinase XerD